MYDLNNFRFHDNEIKNDKYFQKFLSKFEIGDKNSCWLWKGETNKNKPPHKPYGVYRWQSEPYKTQRDYAHRLSYKLWYGDEIKQVIGHTCDNPLCVNPSHLKQYSYRENTQDMIEKGRGLIPEHQKRAASVSRTVVSKPYIVFDMEEFKFILMMGLKSSAKNIYEENEKYHNVKLGSFIDSIKRVIYKKQKWKNLVPCPKDISEFEHIYKDMEPGEWKSINL